MLKNPLVQDGNSNRDDQVCPSLTWKERIYGFLICCVVGTSILPGYILAFLSTMTILLGGRDMRKFGIFYTLGNLIALVGYSSIY